MARIDPSGSVGGRSSGAAAIASLRGGSNPLVRIGVEGGRSVRLSPADLKINNLFGPAINSSNIGFKTTPKLGIESVRFINPPENNIPIRGESNVRPQPVPEVKPNIVAFPERGQVRPINNRGSFSPQGEINFLGNVSPAQSKLTPRIIIVEPVKAKPEIRVIKAPERTSPVILEQYVLARRMRARIASASRPQTGSLVNAEAAAATQSQTGTEPATLIQTSINTAPQTKTESLKSSPTKFKSRNGEIIVSRNNRLEEEMRRKYKERDLEVNAKRLLVLVKDYEGIKAENPLEEVDGGSLARRSLIGSAEALKSSIFFQRGELDREDGSQRRTELFLTSVRAINKEQLKEIVNGNTAIRETVDRPSELPTQTEVNNVFNPLNGPVVRLEPVMVEQITEKLVEGEKQAEVREVAHAISSGQTIELEDIKPEIARTIFDLPPIFDSLMHNDVDEFNELDELSERRKLILAA